MSKKQNNLLYFFLGYHYAKPTLIIIGITTLIISLIGLIIIISAHIPK